MAAGYSDSDDVTSHPLFYIRATHLVELESYEKHSIIRMLLTVSTRYSYSLHFKIRAHSLLNINSSGNQPIDPRASSTANELDENKQHDVLTTAVGGATLEEERGPEGTTTTRRSPENRRALGFLSPGLPAVVSDVFQPRRVENKERSTETQAANTEQRDYTPPHVTQRNTDKASGGSSYQRAPLIDFSRSVTNNACVRVCMEDLK